MPATYYVIASCEDSAYMAWQAKLFHHSCVAALGAAPVLVVHGMHETPQPEYLDVARAGGVVYGAPSYRRSEATGRDYAPRNTAGTLIHASDLTERDDAYFVLCDADMLFARAPAFEAALSGDHAGYMNYETPSVVAAAARLGIDAARLAELGPSLCVGVPYVVPARHARAIGERWLEAIDAFESHDWIDGMYAFGLAAASLGLPVATTSHSMTNFVPDAIVNASMIHYCYGDERWSKRQFLTREQAPLVWQPNVPAGEGTVLGEIVRQIVAAREHYRAADGGAR